MPSTYTWEYFVRKFGSEAIENLFNAAGPEPSESNEFAGGTGGAGVTMDNQADAPEEVTTIVAPGATVSEGSAQLYYVQEADPGAVGANTLWVRVIPGFGYHQLMIRNPANDGWLGLAPIILQVGVDGTTFMESADSEVAMALGVAGEITQLPGGNKTYIDGNNLYNAATADLPTVAPQIMEGTADPSSPGVAAKLASAYFRTNGTAGELWIKTGEANTAWSKLTP